MAGTTFGIPGDSSIATQLNAQDPPKSGSALRAANLNPAILTSRATQTGVITLNPPLLNLVVITGVMITRGGLTKPGIFTGKSPSNEIEVSSQSPFWPAGAKLPPSNLSSAIRISK